MDALQEYFGIEAFDFETNKKKLIDNLNFLKAMSVEEQTFYKKWLEIQTCESLSSKANTIKARIWTPTDINDESLTINPNSLISKSYLGVLYLQQTETEDLGMKLITDLLLLDSLSDEDRNFLKEIVSTYEN